MKDNLDFLVDDTAKETYKNKKSYKIIISDDDSEVHTITKLVLNDIKFEDHSLEFFSAYSEKETLTLLIEHPDTAILFQDVVMDSHDTGLKIVNYLRKELKNFMTRVILRTGQPGEAPEDRIVIDYDINDYRLKTEMTHQRMVTSVYEALRSYRDIIRLEKNRIGLQKIISASSDLFKYNKIKDFYTQVLYQMMSFGDDENAIVLQNRVNQNGFILLNDEKNELIIVGTGRFSSLKNESFDKVEELRGIIEICENWKEEDGMFLSLQNGFVIRYLSPARVQTLIYIEGESDKYDISLITLFLTHFALALDRMYLNEKMNIFQKDIIYSLSEVIENRSKETAFHIFRVSEMAEIFFREKGFGQEEIDMLKVASTMHDIGKIGIPDSILLKPGKLTDEEFSEMKTHTLIGDKILNKTNSDLFYKAALIAKCHHEKYDGTGYPLGLIGEEIPWEARVISLIDVFDALTHERCYKKAWSIEETVDYINTQSSKQFDPLLVDYFNKNLEKFLAIFEAYPD